MLLTSLQGVKGFSEEAFVAAHSASERITSVRFNAEKLAFADNDLTTASFHTPMQAVPWCPSAFYLEVRPSFTFDPLFHAGLYYVQEASSMFLWEVLRQTVGEHTKDKKVLDLCAAPGGKSTLLASYFKDGFVVSNEVIKSRANILSENITKWGTGNVVVTNNDPAHFQRLDNFFDVMVIDAPCSGSGLFRKDETAMDEWSAEAVALCSHRQQRIIADAYLCLRQNGVLIYSTCSYSAEENENVLDWMVEHFDLEPVTLQVNEEWNIVASSSSKYQAPGYRFYPDKVKGEGLFIAAFVKKDGGVFYDSHTGATTISKQEKEAWQSWLTGENTILLKQKELTHRSA